MTEYINKVTGTKRSSTLTVRTRLKKRVRSNMVVPTTAEAKQFAKVEWIGYSDEQGDIFLCYTQERLSPVLFFGIAGDEF